MLGTYAANAARQYGSLTLPIVGGTIIRQLSGKACRCGAILPPDERIRTLFKQRSLGNITAETSCRKMKNYNFSVQTGCELLNRLTALFTHYKYPDVCYYGQTARPMLEALESPPEGEVGDLRGDHGIEVGRFFADALEKGCIPVIGSCIDVGGQNTSTVNRLSAVFRNPELPAIIVEINPLTPALTGERPNIKYAITDAEEFFSSKEYGDCTESMLSSAPNLILFNNVLNLVDPEHAWAMLESAWSVMRPGDYLFISGLKPEQLSDSKDLKPDEEVKGIITFREAKEGKFYKSTLSEAFTDSIEERLEHSSIIVKEDFNLKIKSARPGKEMDIKSCRFLTLRKDAAK